MTIAVDVMGGDYAVSYPVEGAIQAVNDFGLDVVLVGRQAEIESELKKHTYDHQKVQIQDCSEVVEMDESPALALRQKKDSSIRVSVNLHKNNEVDAVVSPGHSGAAMATAKFVLKSIQYVDRPAFATFMPSLKSSFVILDVGANTDCKPEYLLQFGLMGDAYARFLFDARSPRVALLNNGEEEGKGNSVAKEAYDLLKESTLNFVGNVEGKAMFRGYADVVVCDGFIGNITLKVAEGTFDFFKDVLKEEVSKSWLSKLGYLGMRKPFQALEDRADYTEWGGAPLLGVRGTVIICHGNSKPRTIRNAVKHAQECADLDLNKMLAEEVGDNLKLLQGSSNPAVAAS